MSSSAGLKQIHWRRTSTLLPSSKITGSGRRMRRSASMMRICAQSGC